MDWDLTSFFPSFGGLEFKEFTDRLRIDLDELAKPVEPGAAEPVLSLVDRLLSYENATVRFSHLSSYLGCLTAADSADEAYATAEAAASGLGGTLSKARSILLELIGALGDEEIGSLKKEPQMKGATYALQRLTLDARHRMSPAEEALAADLGVDGFDAWGRLYDNLAGNLEFKMVGPDGSERSLPMSQRRSLLGSPDRAIRKAAFEGGNRSWSEVARVAAAALNSLAGTRQTLRSRRGQVDFLEPALFDARISQPCLKALLTALEEQRTDAWDMLRFRADQLGQTRVAWYDLEAPTAGSNEETTISWTEACAWTQSAFDRAYPDLGRFFQSAREKRWIDWSPRRGKRPGGFCTTSALTGESRIFMTYNGAVNDMMTLAHEAGHAYHGHLLADRRGLARSYPMPLAETASTFAEQILIDGIIRDPDASPDRKKRLLDSQVRHAVTFLLDIPIRFHFERRFHEERLEGELQVGRLNELMVETQREWLGDLLEPGGEDPLFWASKLHFYITGLSFYNFPYTFGFLLSRKLFKRFQDEGADFLVQYEDFLRNSTVTDADTLIREVLAEDPWSPDFWASSIETLNEPFAALRSLS